MLEVFFKFTGIYMVDSNHFTMLSKTEFRRPVLQASAAGIVALSLECAASLLCSCLARRRPAWYKWIQPFQKSAINKFGSNFESFQKHLNLKTSSGAQRLMSHQKNTRRLEQEFWVGKDVKSKMSLVISHILEIINFVIRLLRST